MASPQKERDRGTIFCAHLSAAMNTCSFFPAHLNITKIFVIPRPMQLPAQPHVPQYLARNKQADMIFYNRIRLTFPLRNMVGMNFG